MKTKLKVKDIINLNEGGSIFTHTITSIETMGDETFVYLNGNKNPVSKKFITDRIV